MGLISRLLSQCRLPRGRFGLFLAREMNRAHGPMTRWVLSRIPVSDQRSVLDVGCGGGGTILKLSRLLPGAEIHGIDYSPVCVSTSFRTNRGLVEKKRAFVSRACVSHLPFREACFDLALAVESHYFWPDLLADIGEIRRVVRDGGILAIAGGVYFGGRSDHRNRKLASLGGMNCQTLAELSDTLSRAELVDVEVHENERKGWFCVTGRKRGQSEAMRREGSSFL
ncbi:MAG: class I SAM-dependent methyltransferase [Candidatus Eiseniibacteriota bacterium]|nr:MAG: class I SAM-dependent methyltransferase [Candidatus Eisenbacteria bacterium]